VEHVLSFFYYLGIVMACLYGMIAVWCIIWAPACLFTWWWRTYVYPRFPHTNGWYHTARALSEGWHEGAHPPPPQTVNVLVHQHEWDAFLFPDRSREPLPPPRPYRR
jgi:hypothetical protein